MRSHYRHGRRAARRRMGLLVLILSVFGGTAVLAQVRSVPAASPTSARVEYEDQSLNLLVGRSTVIDVGQPISRVSLTSADIADALVTSPSQLLVNAKAPGSITMFVWDRGGAMRRFEVVVERDLATLDRQLTELFPSERIQAQSSGRQIVLTGTASSRDMVDKAVDIAAGFVAGRDEVVSLLQVQQGPRSDQVLLQVRFAEVSRTALTELGLSVFTGPTGIRNTLGRLTTQQFPAPGFSNLEWNKDSSEFGAPVTSASGQLTFSDFLNFFVLSERYDLGLLIRALQTRGLFESLAEPNLVAESGKDASFLAGGEFPIPIAQGSGANIGVSVEFKEFGVRLGFTPTVVGDRVHLRVRPEVSILDYANAVQLGGFRIPALITRRTETELELQDGQTFAIAGLMNNSMTTTMSKIPGLGDIPILGYLFRSRAARKEQTELVVIITPRILPTGSSGVTAELPRMQEPFLEPLPRDRTLPMPPPAFPQPTPGGAMLTPDAEGPTLARPQLTPVEQREFERRAREDRAAQERAERAEREAAARRERAEREAAAQQERAEREAAAQQERVEREAAARAERAEREAERAREAEAKVLAKLAEEERRRAQAEEERLARLARDQAKRDAAAAKKAAEEARRQAEIERKRQEAVARAEANLKAAKLAYEAELARTGS